MNTTTRPGTYRQSEHGFTLVELLVVISIIALLISILLPALKHARNAAELAACLSNEHQLGVAIYAWSNDHDSRVPYMHHAGVDDDKNACDNRLLTWNGTTGGSAGLGYLWFGNMNVTSENATSNITVANHSSSAYLSSYDVFFCPANSLSRYKGQAENDTNWRSRRSSYSYRSPARKIYNKVTVGSQVLNSATPSYDLARNAQRGVVLLYDNVGPNDHQKAWGQAHHDKTNVLFSDGHATTFRLPADVPGSWKNPIPGRNYEYPEGDGFVTWVENGAPSSAIIQWHY